MRLASSMDMLVFSTDSPAAGSESMQERSRAIVPVALSPPGHLPVARFYAPSEYPALAALGRECGLTHVEAGPLVRSSFEADRVADAALISV